MTAASVFWWAPIFPVAAFALLAVGLNRFERLAAALSLVALAGSTVVSALGLYGVYQGQRIVAAVPWLDVGGRQFQLALWLDPLSALIATLVSVVALLVFAYSVSYMARDPLEGRFFTEMNLFAGSMLLLVLAADLLILFVAWELVGLASYLLIAHWFDRPGVPAAATKAFLVTRVGDLALLIGVLLLAIGAGNGSIPDSLAAVVSGALPAHVPLVVALLLFAGAAAKSAQLPLQGWLPDAMLGPTPVSALIHSATMVAAGVFLVARFYPLYLIAPPALSVVAWTGVATALLGAAVALVEPDAKRALAYSTMSQLGLMYVGLGAGSLLAGLLLLIAHALFKSLLFLAVGSAEQQLHSTEFRRMGGLAGRMPLTFLASMVAAAALAGLPVTAALPSKDPLLAAAWEGQTALFALALVASLGTALYSARILGLVFLGSPSEPARHASRSPLGLLIPILSLAALLVAGSLANGELLGRPLASLLGIETPEATVVTALAVTVAVVGFGLGLAARWVWPGEVLWPPLTGIAPIAGNEFGLVPAYRVAGRAGLWLVFASGEIDRRVFDPIGDWLARRLLEAIRLARRFDLQGLDATIRGFGDGVLGFSQRARGLQTGRIENYLLAIFLWGLGIILAGVVGSALAGR